MSQNNKGRRQIVVVEAPAHPVPQLQGPFEESMFESQSAGAEEADVPLDASTRRNMLLDAPTYQRIIAGRWKQKPGERFHPLWKLVAQMSFGIHLLSERMAKSEEDVFQILQTHVDDIDIFLERTTEDFTLAQDDIQERLRCLKLPLQHPEVFERMLEDRTFRNSIVEGNEKIEHIVNRTGCAMKDALKDVQKGFDSANSLEKYLTGLETTWVRQSQEHEAVFVAMLGNVDGWKRAFLDLHMQGNKLAGSLRKLTEVVNQMQQKAGEVSRRLIRQQQRRGGSISNSNSFTYHSRQQSPSRTSSRQQQTHTSQSGKKGQVSTPQTASRAHSRGGSQEASRTDPSLTERSGTGLSMRSGDGRANTPSSRSASRTDTPASGRDPNKLNIGTPRMVFVKGHTGHHRSNSQSTSVRGGQVPSSEQRIDSALSNRSEASQPPLRHQESTISELEPSTPTIVEPKSFAPVELPAEIPPEAFLQAPLSSKNRLSSGLGFLPSERRAHAATASHAFNPTTALVELLRDPSRYSRLPLSASTTASPVLPKHALSALEGRTHLTLEAKQASRQGSSLDKASVADEEISSESTPATPAWAAQVTDDAERSRVLAEKIPFSTRAPSGGAVVAAVESQMLSSKASRPILDTAINPSGAGSRVGQASSSYAPSELSAGYEDDITNLTRQQAEAAMAINTPDVKVNSGTSKKKLSFIAELEGSEPVFLPSTVYTPISAVSTAPMAHELEAPEIHSGVPTMSDSGGSVSGQAFDNSKANSVGLASSTSPSQEDIHTDDENIQIALQNAILKSTSDTAEVLSANPPLVPPVAPEGSTDIPELSSQITPKLRQGQSYLSLGNGATLDENGLSCPADVASSTLQSTPMVNSDVNEKRITTLLTPPLPSQTPSSTLDTSVSRRPTNVNESEIAKSRPVTSIHSPSTGDDIIRPVTPLTATATTVNTSTPPANDKTEASDVPKPSKAVEKSDTLTKAIETVKKNLRPRRTSSITTPVGNAGSNSPASAPGTVTKASPRSSLGANSPASLISVNSAPTADLKRNNTKESRKQWKAFFSGQLKSPRSPATSINSLKSAKSPAASVTSSHKHTNSQASQTNASVKTLWLSSPILPEHSSHEEAPGAEAINKETKLNDSIAPIGDKPPRVELRQQSSPTLGFHEPGLGLSLLTSPIEDSFILPSPSPVVVTATASTAISRSVGAAQAETGARTANPAATSTFVSFPKARVIEVRRKAVGSAEGLTIQSRSASAASTTASQDLNNSTDKNQKSLDSSTEVQPTSPTPEAVNEMTDKTDEAVSTPRAIPLTTVKSLTLQQQKSLESLEQVHVQNGHDTKEPIVVSKDIPLALTINGKQVDNILECEPEEETKGLKADFTRGHEREVSSDSHYDLFDAYA